MQLLESIIEAQPEDFLPQLRALLEHAAAQDILAISGHAAGANWGPRRTLVWLLERLVSFSAFFDDCEACLLALALNESEPQIGNNATAIWLNLFEVYLSGTAHPFPQRLAVLERRLDSGDQRESQIGFQALSNIFGNASGHIMGPPVVAGRLRPSDWQPSTGREERECYEAALSACGKRLVSSDDWRRRLAGETITSRLHFLLYHKMLEQVKASYASIEIESSQAIAIVKSVDDFLERETETGHADANEQARAYLALVHQWVDSLRPVDFDGRLRTVCSRDPWDQRFSTDLATERDETDDLASEIVAAPSRLEPHLDWLASDEAVAGHRLGFAIGRLDDSFVVGRSILEHAIAHGTARLIGGYVRGIAFVGRSIPSDIVPCLDRLDAAHPKVAIEIWGYGGDLVDGLNRSVSLVQSRAVSPRYLFAFAMGIGRRQLTKIEVARLLPHFLNAPVTGDALGAGIRFLTTLLRRDKDKGDLCLLDDETIRETAWSLVDAVIPWLERRETYDWLELLRPLWDFDSRRAAQALGKSLLSDSVGMPDKVEESLVELAGSNPRAVMDCLGAALLDKEKGWKLQVCVLSSLLANIPVEHVAEWVRSHGLEGARRIARHLPPPTLMNQDWRLCPKFRMSYFPSSTTIAYCRTLWPVRIRESLGGETPVSVFGLRLIMLADFSPIQILESENGPIMKSLIGARWRTGRTGITKNRIYLISCESPLFAKTHD